MPQRLFPGDRDNSSEYVYISMTKKVDVHDMNNHCQSQVMFTTKNKYNEENVFLHE